MNTPPSSPRSPHPPPRSRHRWARGALTGAVVAGLLAGCEDGQPPTESGEPDHAAATTAIKPTPTPDVVTAQGTIPLPINQGIASSGPAFGITQAGTGNAGSFTISNARSLAPALLATSQGAGAAVYGQVVGTGTGPAAVFSTTSGNNSKPTLGVSTSGLGPAGQFIVSRNTSSAPAISASTNGTGPALYATSTGSVGRPGWFQILNSNNGSPALFAATNSQGTALQAVNTGQGRAALFQISNSGNVLPAITARTSGGGLAAYFVEESTIPTFATGALVAEANAGEAGHFSIFNTSNPNAALVAETHGTGAAGSFVTAGTGWAGQFFGTSKGVYIKTNGGAGLQVVGGSKNAVVATASGARALYTEESSEVWFTDYGFGRLANGRARILLDPTFAQTVNAEEPYHVFVESYGRAELYVAERTPVGFVVEVLQGDPKAEFSYRVVAKRRGFEAARLERAPWADKATAFARPKQ
jgi:hypothetical protein